MRLKYKKFIVIFTLAIMLIGMGTFSMVAPSFEFSFGGKAKGSSVSDSKSSKELTDKEVEAEITTLVKNYFDAKQRVDTNELKECVSDIEHVEEKRLVTEAEYIEAYKNIECTIRNTGLSSDGYRVYVYYEAKIYDIETLVPSLTALYVKKNEEDKYTIYLNVLKPQEQDAIEKMDNSAEIKSLISSVQKKLEDIVSKNAEVRDFYQMLESTDSDVSEEDNTNIDQEGGQPSSSAEN